MKCLGMDLGTKTLGLATSDRSGLIASPYKLIRFKNVDDAIDEVLEIIQKEKIEVLVLGLPKNMDNSLGFASERSLSFKEKLESKQELKVNLIDERLSTVEAERFLISTDTSRMKRKKIIDAYAANVILDTYLKSKKG